LPVIPITTEPEIEPETLEPTTPEPSEP